MNKNRWMVLLVALLVALPLVAADVGETLSGLVDGVGEFSEGNPRAASFVITFLLFLVISRTAADGFSNWKGKGSYGSDDKNKLGQPLGIVMAIAFTMAVDFWQTQRGSYLIFEFSGAVVAFLIAAIIFSLVFWFKRQHGGELKGFGFFMICIAIVLGHFLLKFVWPGYPESWGALGEWIQVAMGIAAVFAIIMGINFFGGKSHHLLPGKWGDSSGSSGSGGGTSGSSNGSNDSNPNARRTRRRMKKLARREGPEMYRDGKVYLHNLLVAVKANKPWGFRLKRRYNQCMKVIKHIDDLNIWMSSVITSIDAAHIPQARSEQAKIEAEIKAIRTALLDVKIDLEKTPPDYGAAETKVDDAITRYDELLNLETAFFRTAGLT